jgi:hypothetical protein
MANANIVPAQSSYLSRPGTGSNAKGKIDEQFPFAISQSLMLVGKIAWLLLLLGLFGLSFIVWIWIASFRGGWRFWSWAESRPHPEQVSTGLLYGVIILLVSPFFLFVDWTQKQFDKVLPEWMKLPAQVPFRQLFEERLGIKLGEELPFFIEKDLEAEERPEPKQTIIDSSAVTPPPPQ